MRPEGKIDCLFFPGNENWPYGCQLRFVNGDQMNSQSWVSVSQLMPNESVDVSVQMKSPSSPGMYQGQWRMYTATMVPFGGQLYFTFSTLQLTMY